ncbi:MAG: hypothetical protein ABIT76_07240 [Chthoniobacterales bacterium]
MPVSCKFNRLLQVASIQIMVRPVHWRLFFFLLAFGATSLRAEFNPATDTFAFGNETLWAYGNQHRDTASPAVKTGRPYSRRCFVMGRALIQFHQFAEFDPTQPTVSEEEYRQKIRQVCRIPVSQKRKPKEVLIPGFANLQSFSRAYPALLEENLGNWWPTYFRFGNWRMGLPFPRSGQREVAEKLTQSIDSGSLAAVYITRFKPLNHCLVAYRYRRTRAGLVFSVVDPNLPGKICQLTFDSATSSFEYQKTWYYPGGRVNVIRVYHTRWL